MYSLRRGLFLARSTGGLAMKYGLSGCDNDTAASEDMPVSIPVSKNALGFLQSGKLAEAERLCRRALARNPKDAEALHVLGRIAMASGSYPAAACLIGQAIQLAGPQPGLCMSLARALENLGQPGKAAACYLQALEQIPDNASVWLQLGRLFLQAQEFERAKECFQQILILSVTPSPEAADAQFELGNICHLQDDSAGAAEHYERALLYRPDHVEACFH